MPDEQPGLNHNHSYIAHYNVCPPPINCSNGFYDASAFGVVAGPPEGPFSLSRANVTSFNTPAFIVSSLPVPYKFIGSGDWSDPQNWINEMVPPIVNSETVITDGMEVIINPSSGECNYVGTIRLQPGGKLTIPEGKKLNIRPRP